MKTDFNEWLKCAGIRAIKTIAQSALGALSGCVLFSEVNWTIVASTSLLSGIYSILTSVAGIPEVELKEKLKGE